MGRQRQEIPRGMKKVNKKKIEKELLGIPKRIKQLMRIRGIRMQALSRLSGIDKTSLSRVMRGLRTPSAKFISCVAAALDADAGYILTGRQ